VTPMNFKKIILGAILLLLAFSTIAVSAGETFSKDVNSDGTKDMIATETTYVNGNLITNLQIVDGRTHRDMFIKTCPIGNLPSHTEKIFFENGLLMILHQIRNKNQNILVYKCDRFLNMYLPHKLVKVNICDDKLKTSQYLYKIATKFNGISLAKVKNFYYLMYYAKHNPNKINSLVNIQRNFSGNPMTRIKEDIDKEILYIHMNIVEPNEFNKQETYLDRIFVFFTEKSRGRNIEFNKTGIITMYESNGEMDIPAGLY
jgi:hypothetical protein